MCCLSSQTALFWSHWTHELFVEVKRLRGVVPLHRLNMCGMHIMCRYFTETKRKYRHTTLATFRNELQRGKFLKKCLQKVFRRIFKVFNFIPGKHISMCKFNCYRAHTLPWYKLFTFSMSFSLSLSFNSLCF